jgi:hypothetical protein
MNPCIVYRLTSPINELILREYIPFALFINWNYNKSSQNTIIYYVIFKFMFRPYIYIYCVYVFVFSSHYV